MNTCGSFVFLTKFFHETAVDEILQFLVRTKAKHFFATAYGISQFKVLKHSFEEIVESEYFLFRKDIAEFIGHVVWKSPGKPGSFGRCCHSETMVA